MNATTGHLLLVHEARDREAGEPALSGPFDARGLS